ncbi:MAG: ester cyclase [Solirubrobacterales bacterium]|nr:MAG: ester cyclase [Solirubrobacterales bacterium]PZS14278.1 MAG: ester cyclase [Solirubrobacterales bacterium]
MNSETNIAALERMAEMVNTGNLDTLDEVVDQDAVDHDPAPGQERGPEGFKDFFSTLRAAFPDLKLEPVTVVADDEHVAMAYTINGTHQGEFQGIAASGRRISARGVEIVKFRDGKLIERWGSSDELGILMQLGLTLER